MVVATLVANRGERRHRLWDFLGFAWEGEFSQRIRRILSTIMDHSFTGGCQAEILSGKNRNCCAAIVN
jgi:hypothetical protein